MKVLAFDQSTNVTGYSIWESGKLCDYGVIDLHKVKDTGARFYMMVKEIREVINKRQPDVIVIEDVAQQSNINVMKILAQLQGCIYALGLLSDLPVQTIKPTVWRQTLEFRQGAKVKRQELKEQALCYIKENFGLDVIEDVAEAICIGQAWCLSGDEE